MYIKNGDYVFNSQTLYFGKFQLHVSCDPRSEQFEFRNKQFEEFFAISRGPIFVRVSMMVFVTRFFTAVRRVRVIYRFGNLQVKKKFRSVVALLYLTSFGCVKGKQVMRFSNPMAKKFSRGVEILSRLS